MPQEVINIKACLDQFVDGQGKNKGRHPNERYASFDYCYGYFYSFYKNGKTHELANDNNLQMSCLQIGFYLASWGMLRGSSFLLERSLAHIKELVVAISKMNSGLWEIDADNYNDATIIQLLDCKQQIGEALGSQYNPSDTLVTKVMLGVFANIPAYDTYFRKSLGVHSVNRKSLMKIRALYEDNKSLFDSYKIYTYNFSASNHTNIIYTKAKLIDMCCFIDGQSK